MTERRVLDNWKEIAAYLGRTGKTCRNWEKEYGLPVHRLDGSPRAHIFAYADELERWKEEMLREEKRHKGTEHGLEWDKKLLGQNKVGGLILRLLPRLFRKPLVAVPGLLILAGVVASAVWFFGRQSKIRWANNVAIPEIERLMTVTDWNKTADLAFKAEKYIPESPLLARLMARVIAVLSVETDPVGADVYIEDYSDAAENWRHVGKSPVRDIRLSQGFKHWRIEKAGFETAEGTIDVNAAFARALKTKLAKKGEIPPGMVRVNGGDFRPSLNGLSHLKSLRLGDYLLDRNEVTNRQYKEFVDAGGYKRREYWKETFVKDGRVIPWEAAIKELVDKTGRPGPATWELGDYPQGQDEYPVSGVSWYEASAYAEFAGKTLPSVYHWNKAAFSDLVYSFSIPFCNLQGRALAPVGSFKSLGPFGTYDMGGNVKEWCANETEGKRLILGGAWNETQYMFGGYDSYPPFYRFENFGFRCLKIRAEEADPPEAYDPVTLVPPPDFSRLKPCSDAVFEIIRNQYVYTKTELKAKVESQREWSEYTRVEKVSYTDAYGEERIMAHLFIPRRGQPPFQTIIHIPGGQAWQLDSIYDYAYMKDGEIEIIFNKKGRAFVLPVFDGTFERRRQMRKATPQGFRDRLIRIYRDMSRCIDYLETRPEFDKQKFVLHGLSSGAWMGPLLAALEKRFGAAIFLSGGFWNEIYLPQTYTAETDMIHFAPRVKIPVLMQNGRYDFQAPLETNLKILFNLLGTPEKDKYLQLYETGHSVWLVNESRKDRLDFLDKYLGPVE
jgi:formylglycine-generating enzyme required for sulfatase activity/cephalosporin-C deacetylase-like acetyl esterase